MEGEKVFLCWCGIKVNYENEDLMTNHIKSCDKYHKESPFFREFQKLPLEKLREVHLVAIKCEF